MIRRTESGWLVDVQPGGRSGKRYRKTLSTKGEAERWQRWVIAQVERIPDWRPPERDQRRLSDLVQRWYDLHGVRLRSGARRRRKLQALVSALGDPFASAVTAQVFAEYRSQRLSAGVCPNTVNHDHAYLRALFNELARLGEWDAPNPVAKVRRLKVLERELAFLTDDQVVSLLGELRVSRNSSVYLVALVCLATGARWSEAETLRAEQVGVDRVTFGHTKSGRVRVVPVSPELSRRIRTCGSGRLFLPCYDAFRGAVVRAGLVLPSGQLSHVLRHTFASRFMQNGGNILVLQRALGHASLAMTMRYAHCAPDHLDDVRRLNPLASLTIG